MDICNNKCYIYVARNIENNKRYVGQTRRNVDERIKEHLKECKRSTLPFHMSIKKHGIDNFEIEKIEVPEYLLNEEEKYYINKFDTMNPEHGYNIKPGGSGYYEKSLDEISRHKMGWNRGLKLSEEHKKKISESHKKLNFHHSEETKEKISKINKGKLTGVKQSEDHKNKRVESLKSVNFSSVKPVKFIDPDNNIYIEKHSVKNFCEEHNLCRRNVYYVLSGKAKTHKGWKIEYY